MSGSDPDAPSLSLQEKIQSLLPAGLRLFDAIVLKQRAREPTGTLSRAALQPVSANDKLPTVRQAKESISATPCCCGAV